ncbi:unnamed protein product [Ectocarpus fasciculatus]
MISSTTSTKYVRWREITNRVCSSVQDARQAVLVDALAALLSPESGQPGRINVSRWNTRFVEKPKICVKLASSTRYSLKNADRRTNTRPAVKAATWVPHEVSNMIQNQRRTAGGVPSCCARRSRYTPVYLQLQVQYACNTQFGGIRFPEFHEGQ